MKETRRTYGKRIGVLSALLLFAVVCAFAAAGCAKVKESHKYVEHAATESTCTQAGNDLYYTCEDCDKIFDADKNEIAAIPVRALKEHDWDAGVKTADADCEHGVAYTLTCRVGGETKTEYRGDALGHDWGAYTVTENDEQATCKRTGTETAKCTRCDATDTRATQILPHSFGSTPVARVEAQTGSMGTPCSAGVEAHYRCSMCQGYFTGEGAEKTETTLEALTIAAPHSYAWQHDDYMHKHVCSHCGDEKDVAPHTFASAAATACEVCDYTATQHRVLAAFTDEHSFVTTNSCPPDMNGGIYTVGIAELPSSVQKPDSLPNAGNKALRLQTTAVGWWSARVAIPLGTLLRDDVNDADKVHLHGYRTGPRWGDGSFVLGNVTEAGGKTIFDAVNTQGQKLNNTDYKTAIAADPTTGAKWFTLTWTVAELKAALRAQGHYEGPWMLIDYNMNDAAANNTGTNEVYFYALEFERETARNITNSATAKVTVAENAVPLQKVTVTANNLGSGECVYVRNAENKVIATFLMSGGEFVMPYSDVTITVEDLFAAGNTNAIFTEIPSALYNVESLALPALYAQWSSAGYTVEVTGEVPAADYVYDSTHKTIYFTKSGTYTLTYTLSRTGEQSKTYNRTVAVRDVLAAFENDADVAGRSNWNNEREYTSELVSLPAAVGKPSGATDAGEQVWKFTEKTGDNYYYTPTIYLGEFLNHLDGFADDDYIRVWMYRGATYGDNSWMLGNVDGNHIFWDTKENAEMPGQSRDNMKVLGEAGTWNLGAMNTWGALDISVAELRAQLAAQGCTDAHYLQLRLNTAPDAVNYIYSVELRRREGVIASYANGLYTRFARFGATGESADKKGCLFTENAPLSQSALDAKPSNAPNVGNTALKVTAYNGSWHGGVAIYLGDILNNLDSYNANDYISIWTYWVGDRYGDTAYIMGNLQQNAFDPNYAADNDMINLGTGCDSGFLKGWMELKFTVTQLQQAMTDKSIDSAMWMAFLFNTTPVTDNTEDTAGAYGVYVYASEFHRASAN